MLWRGLGWSARGGGLEPSWVVIGRMRSTTQLVRWFKQRTHVDDEVLRRSEARFESYAQSAGPLLADTAGGPHTCPCADTRR